MKKTYKVIDYGTGEKVLPQEFETENEANKAMLAFQKQEAADKKITYTLTLVTSYEETTTPEQKTPVKWKVKSGVIDFSHNA